MNLTTFYCGHDDRLWRAIDHHRDMIPGEIVPVYAGIRPDPRARINTHGKYLGDGHAVPIMAIGLQPACTHVLYISHDALILDKELIQKSIDHMSREKIDILAPSLTTAEIGPYTYDGQPVKTSIICLVMFTAKTFLWLGKAWPMLPRLVSEEVLFYEAPHRAGFTVSQNPYILPDHFTPRYDHDETRHEGGAIHPHKECE